MKFLPYTQPELIAHLADFPGVQYFQVCMDGLFLQRVNGRLEVLWSWHAGRGWQSTVVTT